MGVKTITPTDVISDSVDYYAPRYIQFYDNHIDNFGNNLIVKTKDPIESPIVTIGDKKYVSNLVGEKLSQINFNKVLEEPITIKNASINVQMTLELQ
jgi:hypothetical protein